MKCKCTIPMHDKAGCLTDHDGMLGDICQPCYKTCYRFDPLMGLKILPCKHIRYKKEISFNEDTGKEIINWYCLVCSTYINDYVKSHTLPPSDESITSFKITKWTPDTCTNGRCVTEYHWDRHSEQDSRTHTYHRTVRKCNDHSEIHGKEHHDTITQENNLKNDIHKHVSENLKLDTSRDDIPILSWKFSGSGKDRILNISHPDFTEGHKNSILDFAEKKYGRDKVKVD